MDDVIENEVIDKFLIRWDLISNQTVCFLFDLKTLLISTTNVNSPSFGATENHLLLELYIALIFTSILPTILVIWFYVFMRRLQFNVQSPWSCSRVFISRLSNGWSGWKVVVWITHNWHCTFLTRCIWQQRTLLPSTSVYYVSCELLFLLYKRLIVNCEPVIVFVPLLNDIVIINDLNRDLRL